MKHKKFTQTERELLSQWIREGGAKKEIARRLRRDIRTIQREIIRNKTRVSVGKEWEIIYEPVHAQYAAIERKQNAFLAKQPLKNKNIYKYVLKHLRGGWSPEGISGRLREVDHKGEKDWQICMETIYAFIYKEKTDKTRQGQLSESDGRKKKTKIALTVTDVSQPAHKRKYNFTSLLKLRLLVI